jgi:hypothetical protein
MGTTDRATGGRRSEQGSAMRWDVLFADLEAQAEELDRLERATEVSERTRIEVGALGLLERLRPAAGSVLRMRCRGDLAVTGSLRRVATEWALLDTGTGREIVLALGKVVSVAGLSRLSAVPDPESAVESRLGIRHALRAIAADRSVCHVWLEDATSVFGTVDRVGKDFIEVAVHSSGELRRRGDVREVALIALGGLVALHREALC